MTITSVRCTRACYSDAAILNTISVVLQAGRPALLLLWEQFWGF